MLKFACPSLLPSGHCDTFEDTFKVQGLLGEGSYAAVYHTSLLPSAPDQSYPKVMACKVLYMYKCKQFYKREHDAFLRLASFKRVNDQRRGTCPDVVSLVQCYRQAEMDTCGRHYGVFFLELLPHLTLDKALKRVEKEKAYLPPSIVFHFAHQLAQALATLHRAKIAHRDIKDENVAVDWEAKRVILYDLGFAECAPLDKPIREHRVKYDTLCSPLYMAPEQWPSYDSFNPFYSDIWQFGQLCHCLMTNVPVFNDCRKQSDIERKLFVERPIPWRHDRIKNQRDYKDLLAVTLIYSPPVMRATADHLEHRLVNLTHL